MLPAIWFILSRVGCDQAALSAGAGRSLTTPAEQAAIQAELDELKWAAFKGALGGFWGMMPCDACRACRPWAGLMMWC
jgi:hypothetical protein